MTAKILIVDDTPANLTTLRAILAPLDRPIVSASSGEEALLQVLASAFAVILLDVKMPGMDGFETARLIRNRDVSREIPILFLTAHEETAREAQRAYDVGAFDFISKPFNVDILRHKVAGFVRLCEQAQELADAKETARLREVFLGVLGHDLRNPLGSIMMAAALLGRAADIPERHRRTIDRILRSSTRMKQLIGDMLDFTRGRIGGGIPIAPEDADLDEICRNAVAELQMLHPGKSILVDVRGDARGRWDGARLGQVVSNLVGNAVQHASGNSVRIVVDGTDPMTVRLVVTNAGVIPTETLRRVFEPFQRGDSPSAGLGLGLYIVHDIAHAHSGSVDVRSDAELGETEFVVKLPRHV